MESTSPTSELNKPFKGIFDGCNHEINGLYINTTNKVQGLFGIVINGQIKNLGIGEKNSITGGVSTGALAGYIYDNVVIFNCYNIGNIQGTNQIGRIVGRNTIYEPNGVEAIIKNSYSLQSVCNSIYGYNSGKVENSSLIGETELKNSYNILGSAFKEDTNNINNGYPILSWQ